MAGVPAHVIPLCYKWDIVVAGLVSLTVLYGFRVWNLASDVLIAFYIISLHFYAFYGSFIDVSILNLQKEITMMSDSFVSVLNIPLIITFPFAIMLRRFLYYFVLRFSWETVNKTWLRAGFASMAVLFFVSFVPAELYSTEYKQNPVSKFVFSIFSYYGDYIETFPELDSVSVYDYASLEEGTPVQQVELNSSGNTEYNVVMLFLESTASKHIREYGESITPNLLSLKNDGVYFENFYAMVPLSIKSLFSALTGHSPSADIASIGGTHPDVRTENLPMLFKQNGYNTGLLHGGHFEFSNKTAFLKGRGYDTMHDADSVPGTQMYEHTGYGVDDEAIFSYAEEWIGQSDRPFFLTLIPLLPHHPYNPPAKWKGSTEGEDPFSMYLSSLEYEDYLLGKFISFLKKTGRYEKTILVVFGDHGQAFGSHPGNYLHSGEIYEENIHIPLFISNPVLFKGNQTSSTIGSMIDLLPTICGLTGMSWDPALVEGQNLIAPGENRLVYFYTGLAGHKVGLRDANYKFIFRMNTQNAELYDLETDSMERNNIASEHPDKVETYLKAAVRWKYFARTFIEKNSPGK